MRVFYNSEHSIHQPPSEVFNGNREDHQEVPQRVEQILNALKDTDHEVQDVMPTASQREALAFTLRQLHQEDYLEYLQNTDFGKEYVYPSVFPYRQESRSSDHPVAKRGFYSFDLYTPLSNTTFEAASVSALLAKLAAESTLKDGRVTYALCRPPGHHAEPAHMGGYCYLNNGGVAAQTFVNDDPANKVAILDVDFHHGNGTEKIFGEREDVLTVSLHADPNVKFPFYSGQDTDEYKSNKNLPLPLGTGNREFQHALETGLEAIREHKTTHLVVSYGADTHESDPIGGFKLTTEYYTEMACQIAALNVLVTIVQEGGYNTAALGHNVVAFLAGFE